MRTQGGIAERVVAQQGGIHLEGGEDGLPGQRASVFEMHGPTGYAVAMPRRLLVFAPLLVAASCQVPAPEPEQMSPYDYQLADGEYGIERLPYGEAWPDFSIGWQRRTELLEAAQKQPQLPGQAELQGFLPGRRRRCDYPRPHGAFGRALRRGVGTERFR